MKKRQGLLALLLSFGLAFGLCESGVSMQEVQAQEAAEEEMEEKAEDEAKENEEDVQETIDAQEEKTGEEIGNTDNTASETEITSKPEEVNKLENENKAEGRYIEDEDDIEQTLYAEGLINDAYEYAEEEPFNEGDTVKLEVEAKSNYKNAKLTYEWYKTKNNDFLVDDAVKINENSSAYTTKKTGVKKEYYLCRVSDGNESQDITFTITGNLLKVSQYINGEPYTSHEFPYGSELKLEVRPEKVSSEYRITYSWESYTDDVGDETGNTCTIKLDKKEDRDEVYSSCHCRVALENSEGEEIQHEWCDFYIRGEETLNYNAFINGEKQSAMDFFAYSGEEVALKVAASSSMKDRTVTYAWYKYDSETGEEILLSSSGEYKFKKDDTEYQSIWCKITDGIQEDSVPFNIFRKSRIQGNRRINGQQTGNMYFSKPAEQCELKVELSSKPVGDKYEYSWSKCNNIDINEEYDEEIYETLSGTDNVILGKVTGDCTYCCKVKDGNETEYFKFRLYADSMNTSRLINQKELVGFDDSEDGDYQFEAGKTGEKVTLGVAAQSTYSSEITYEWYEETEDGDPKLLGREASCQIVKEEPGAEGHIDNYYCVVSDGFQTEELWFSIGVKSSIEGNILVDGKSLSSMKAVPGQTYQLEMNMTSSPKTGSYRYIWGTYNSSIGMLRRLSTTSKCEVKAGEYDTDYYVCKVIDGNEEKMFTFELELNTLDVVQKVNGKLMEEHYLDVGERITYLDAGEEAVLTVDASSSYAQDKITYEWELDEDTEIEGTASGNQYKVTKQKGKWQLYYCEVSDGNSTERVGFALWDNTLSGFKYAIDGASVSELQCAEGTKHTMTVEAVSSMSDADLMYSWRRIDKDGYSRYIDNRNKNTLTITRKDETETYCCEISDGTSQKVICFNFSEDGSSCSHELETVITKATLTQDGSSVSRCTKCGKVDSSVTIPYPRTIRLTPETFTYNGQVQTPAVSVIGSDGKVIGASNYTVSYSAGSTAVGTYKATITFRGNYSGSIDKTYTITNPAPAAGTVLKASGSNVSYKVVAAGNSVEYAAAPNKKVKSASVPATVTINNITYKVTSIAPNAFKNCKKLKKVTISANIQTIGKQAFSGCKSLKTITVKSKSITKIGSKAFKGINKKAKIKVPKAKLKAYKKLFKKGGLAKSVKIKK